MTRLLNCETQSYSPEARGAHENSEMAEQRFPVEFDGGLDRDRRRNMYQGMSVIVFMGIGATFGYLQVADRPDIAALAGAVVGKVVGTFLSGIVMMRIPPK